MIGEEEKVDISIQKNKGHSIKNAPWYKLSDQVLFLDYFFCFNQFTIAFYINYVETKR